MLHRLLVIVFVLPVLIAAQPSYSYAEESVQSFVVQLTRKAEGYGHRRVMLQLDKILTESHAMRRRLGKV